jgi:Asp-tRNA(Asn)/Glu-tRNA(Gln) amidotransferase A subunit family amidase
MLRRWIEWLEGGEKKPAELLETCLRHIREQDAEVQAWVEVNPQEPLGHGPLDGIPFGAKDIYETRGLATEYGSPLYAGRKGERDAALVEDLRRRGAVLLGKTHTTAFAYFDPAPTRNPRAPGRTPGGSSSGSAAAVAAGMVPFALGSQTQGSVLRPAAFCGVTGFKPTFGVLPLDGVLPFAPSLDTAGLFTETADDMRVLWERMGHPVDREHPWRLGVSASLGGQAVPGFAVDRIELPPVFAELLPAARLINDYEGARTHEERWKQYGERIGERLAQLVREGLAIPAEKYQAALATVARAKREMAEVFRTTPVIMTPAATGPAPLGLATTGDPRMNAPWTALGVPAISVPLPVGDAPPLGLQLTADAGRDAMLLAVAAAVAQALSGAL